MSSYGLLFSRIGVVIAPAAITRLLLPSRTPPGGDQAAARSESFLKTANLRGADEYVSESRLQNENLRQEQILSEDLLQTANLREVGECVSESRLPNENLHQEKIRSEIFLKITNLRGAGECVSEIGLRNENFRRRN